MKKKYIKHGYTTGGISKIYRNWYQMIERCTNPLYPDYKYYGARGIKVSKRWQKNIQNFIDDMGFPKEGMTLDRIDNDGNYEKKNCRWSTRSEQRNNSRSIRYINYKGKLMNLTEAAKLMGIRRHTLWQRHFRKKY